MNTFFSVREKYQPPLIAFLLLLFSSFTSLSHSSEPLLFFHAESFLQRDQTLLRGIKELNLSFDQLQLPSWMLANIQNEFSEFKPFKSEDLDEYFLKSGRSLAHFRIRNGALFFRCNYSHAIPHPIPEYVAAIYAILHQPGCRIETGDFLMDVEDGAQSRRAPYPILCFSKERTSNSNSRQKNRNRLNHSEICMEKKIP